LLLDTANNGEEAVKLAKENDYSLILMDMQMPIMNGIDATLAIRKLPACQTIPILAMTANAFIEDRERCLASGMNDFIAKPADPEVVFRMVYQWLGDNDGMPQPASEKREQAG